MEYADSFARVISLVRDNRHDCPDGLWYSIYKLLPKDPDVKIFHTREAILSLTTDELRVIAGKIQSLLIENGIESLGDVYSKDEKGSVSINKGGKVADIFKPIL
jgi:hypothetical protein